MLIRYLFAVFATVFFVGCASPTYLTKRELRDHGVKHYQFSADDVYQATVDSLQSLGYDIQVSKQHAGVVVTKPFLIGKRKVKAEDGKTYTVEDERQYRIIVERLGALLSKVIVEPKAIENGDNVSGKEVWYLEGEEGERERWTRIFTQIDSRLAQL